MVTLLQKSLATETNEMYSYTSAFNGLIVHKVYLSCAVAAEKCKLFITHRSIDTETPAKIFPSPPEK